MLKQRTENKQLTDTFEGIDGRWLTRSDLEDSSRPGYLKPDLVPIEPQVWSAGAHFGLLTPTGRPMRYVETAHDPREPRVEEAPVELREQVAKAEAVSEDVCRKIQAVVDERVKAEVEWRHAAARGNAEAYNRAVAREHEATERQRDLGLEEAVAIKRLSDAQEAVRKWIWDERFRRYEKAKM